MQKELTTLVSFVLLFFCENSYSQGMKLETIGYQTGLNFSNFLIGGNAKNPSLELKSGVYPAVHTYFEFTSKRFALRPEVGYKGLGCNGTLGSQTVNWRLKYLDVGLGLIYHVLKTERFTLSPGLIYGFSYMLEGEQYIGNTRFTEQNQGFLKKTDLIGQFMMRGRWKLSELAFFQAEYRFGISFLNLENNQEGQTTRNNYHSLLIGLSIQLKKKEEKKEETNKKDKK
jgi:hypothetical protein